MSDPTHTAAWKTLERLHDTHRHNHLRDWFSDDPARAQRYQHRLGGLTLNFSRQRINDEILIALCQLADDCQLKNWVDKLFDGERINHTENRAVLHTALRAPNKAPFNQVCVDGEAVSPLVHRELDKMAAFVERVHSGKWQGCTGKPIDTVVNIGIGGSDLGPKMAYEALRAFHVPDFKVRFVSNLDSTDFAATLEDCNPETTLFVIASKTFTTQETMRNAETAKTWLIRHAPDGLGDHSLLRNWLRNCIGQHFVALSTAVDKVTAFGIREDNIFEFWDWVGGRYSLWSAIGLPLALGIGMLHFRALLDGAHAMDSHFRATPWAENLPVLLALLGIWNRNFLGAASLAVVPYPQLLADFPAYLQQLDMESNGKSVSRNGKPIDYATGPVIWGSTGNNAQHAYFQHLHQSQTLVPVDFIGTLNASHTIAGHQELLFSNMIGQAEAMMMGKTVEQATQEHAEKTLPESLIPYRVFPGNTPSNVLLIDHLIPFTLGQLIALYEHKVFVQGVIWNINSFDQWGVELGKTMAGDLAKALESTNHHYSSAASAAIDVFKAGYLDNIHLPKSKTNGSRR